MRRRLQDIAALLALTTGALRRRVMDIAALPALTTGTLRRRVMDIAALLALTTSALLWFLVPQSRHPLHMVGSIVLLILWPAHRLTTEVTTRVRERRAAVSRPLPDRPVVTIDEYGRGDWLYHPRADAVEIELRLRHRRYMAHFTRDEMPIYRTTLLEITAALEAGTDAVDVNKAFAAKLDREPFEDRGLIPRTPLDRLLRIPRRPPRPGRYRMRAARRAS